MSDNGEQRLSVILYLLGVLNIIIFGISSWTLYTLVELKTGTAILATRQVEIIKDQGKLEARVEALEHLSK